MGPQVVEMHFVCRDDRDVVDFGDGTFETGVWFVSTDAAHTVRTLALHNDKRTPSYRQGAVIGRRDVQHNGKTRYVFRVRDNGRSMAWAGGGSGEKGYLRG